MAPVTPSSRPVYKGIAAAAMITAPLVGFPQPGNTAAENAPTIRELLLKIEQRDALIDDLQRRVQNLERQVHAPGAPRPPAPPPSAAAPPGPAPAGSPPPPTAAAPETTPPPPRQPATAPQTKTAKTAPGQFEVDEEAAQRALERTLVITGALLLPYGQMEVQPGFTYVHAENDFPSLLSTSRGLIVASSSTRADIIGGNIFMRLGLPLDSQLEFNVPYQSRDQDINLDEGGRVLSHRDATGTGFGDVRVGLAKTVLREKRWWPDVIARLTWDSDTGQTDDGIRLGSGFDELQGSLTVTKRQDPLVFIGSVSYQSAFEKNNIRPGDDLGFTLGVVLAASPETSLRVVLNQVFVDNVEVGGSAIRGTDQVIGTLNFGASSIIGRGILLDFTTGIGLTRNAPDYSVGASFAMRYDLPFLPRL
jgi:hypothetical protein